jgi:hypothetical protein
MRQEHISRTLCLLFVMLQSIAARETAESWSDWMSQGKGLYVAGNYADAAGAFRQALSLVELAETGYARRVGMADGVTFAQLTACRLAIPTTQSISKSPYRWNLSSRWRGFAEVDGGAAATGIDRSTRGILFSQLKSATDVEGVRL